MVMRAAQVMVLNDIPKPPKPWPRPEPQPPQEPPTIPLPNPKPTPPIPPAPTATSRRRDSRLCDTWPKQPLGYERVAAVSLTQFVLQNGPGTQKEVIVYCANVRCHASDDVARQLSAGGYAHVGHYAGGKADWTVAGLPVERG